jgi:hypothetical protein
MTTDVPCNGCTTCCRTNVQIPTDAADHRMILALSPGGYLPRHENHDCMFLDRDTGCVIYDIRPKFCRGFDCRKTLAMWPDIPQRRKFEIETQVGKDMIDELLESARTALAVDAPAHVDPADEDPVAAPA